MSDMAERVDRLTPDQMEKLQDASGSKDAAEASVDQIRRWQMKAIPSLDAQLEGLHSNWQRIVNGYVVYQKRTLPRSVIPRQDR
jgi:hypothetical protein